MNVRDDAPAAAGHVHGPDCGCAAGDSAGAAPAVEPAQAVAHAVSGALSKPSAPADGSPAWLDDVKFDAAGLIPAIAQDAATGEVVMVAWMNRDSLAETAATMRGCYWSRSRNRFWRKGEESGHVQLVREIRLDCDADVVLLKVEQVGGIACHTGRRSCFYRRLDDGAWTVTDAPLKDPESIYK